MTPARVIGRDGRLPWHLPEDLRFFRRTTTGHPIVMGRKTFESIGKPLPRRQNIILTRNPSWKLPGAIVIHHPADLRKIELLDPRVYLIGGAQVYELFLPLVDELLVSWVYQPHPGDTWFPEFEHLFRPPTLVKRHEHFEIRRYLRPGSRPRHP